MREALLRRGIRRARAPRPTPTLTPRTPPRLALLPLLRRMSDAAHKAPRPASRPPSPHPWCADTRHIALRREDGPRRRTAALHRRPRTAGPNGHRSTNGGGRSGHGDDGSGRQDSGGAPPTSLANRRPYRRAPPQRSLTGCQAPSRRLQPPPRRRLCRKPRRSSSPGAHAAGTSIAGRGPPPDPRVARRGPAAALLGSLADFRQLPPAAAWRRGGGRGVAPPATGTPSESPERGATRGLLCYAQLCDLVTISDGSFFSNTQQSCCVCLYKKLF